MKSRKVETWSFQSSSPVNGANDNGFIMFSCPFVGTNILYTFQQVKEILEGCESSIVPAPVMQEAMDTYINAPVTEEAIRA